MAPSSSVSRGADGKACLSPRSGSCAGSPGPRHGSRSSSTPPRFSQQSMVRPQLQSIVVRPDNEGVNDSPSSPKWTLVTSRRGRSRDPCPLPATLANDQMPSSVRRAPRRSSVAADAARAAFLRRFRGLCFRCLSKNHRRRDCRDPLRCIECRNWGHSSSSPRCPARLRPPSPSPAPRPPVRERLRFPAPPPPAAMLSRVIALPAPRRSSCGHSVIMSTPLIEHEVRMLRSRGVVVQSTVQFHAANPLLVGKEIEAKLRLPPHILRVTRHHPEAFFIKFDFPKHRDAAVRLGRISVEGSTFLLLPWREDDHAVHQRWTYHARVCIERMPLHMWNLDGAREVLGKQVVIDRLDCRTYAQEDTVLFSCWVWCWELAHIPSRHPFFSRK